MKAAAALPVKGNRSKSWIKVATSRLYLYTFFFVLFFSFGGEAHREREERLVLGKNKMKNIIRKRIPLLNPVIISRLISQMSRFL